LAVLAAGTPAGVEVVEVVGALLVAVVGVKVAAAMVECPERPRLRVMLRLGD
jgi:hypothetical protein